MANLPAKGKNTGLFLGFNWNIIHDTPFPLLPNCEADANWWLEYLDWLYYWKDDFPPIYGIGGHC